MNIRDVIQVLEEIKEEYGDLQVFTNGEHGLDDTQEMQLSYISVGSAHMQFDVSDMHIDPDKIVCHIGGY